jgi:hypothetical protein
MARLLRVYAISRNRARAPRRFLLREVHISEYHFASRESRGMGEKEQLRMRNDATRSRMVRAMRVDCAQNEWGGAWRVTR